MDLSLMEWRDSEARIQELCALMDCILTQVHASLSRAVELVLVQKVVGPAMYCNHV